MTELVLKPCPFCGATPRFIDRNNDGDYPLEKWFYDVGCRTENCYLEFGADWWLKTKEEAAEMWNKRA